MSNSSFQSEIPKARINLKLDLHTGGASKKTELPLKLLVAGDFSNGQETAPLSERKKVNLNKNNFDSVLSEYSPIVNITVKNTLAGDGSEDNINLTFQSINDFSPEQVSRQIPQLKAMLSMRNLLRDLKANLLDNQAFRKELEKILLDPALSAELRAELSALAPKQPYDDASVEHISYAQCALLDETVMSRKSEKGEEGEEPKVDEGQVAWRKAPLQARFFGSFRAGEALWDRIAEVLRQPSPNPAVLTCYHRVIALGFQGLYSLKTVSQSERDVVVKALSERVNQANSQMQALNSAAEAAGALVSDISTQISLVTDKIKDLQSAVLLGSAPQGVAFTSGEHLQLSSTRNTMINAGQHLDVGAMKNLSVSVEKALGLFVHKDGAKLVANQGDIEIQAQHNTMALFSEKQLTVTSSEDEIIISTPETLTLNGGGSYLRLSKNGIEHGSEGMMIMKVASYLVPGTGASQQMDTPDFKVTNVTVTTKNSAKWTSE